MKLWHVVAGAGGLVALWYLWPSSSNGFIRAVAPVSPANGPATEAASGRGHFVTPLPLKSSGPTVEAATGRGHF